MSQLAIRGHATRGSEVIELLEMLGADRLGYKDTFVGFYYYIEYIECGVIVSSDECPIDAIVFTLEEFEKKFPYKVGDKVNYVKYNDEYPSVYTIQRMLWNGVTIEYVLDSSGFSALTKDLQPYIEETIEETMEEKDEKTVKHVFNANVISFDIAQKDKYELDLQGKFKVVLREGKYYVERIKLRYPKTYMECCKVLGISRHDVEIDLPQPYQQKMFNLFKLHICRDAYWKDYGEHMGLGNPWEPDWTNTNSNKYCIYYVGNEIKKQPMLEVRHFLAFPTTEMCNEFYVNFKDLIEQCTEL